MGQCTMQGSRHAPVDARGFVDAVVTLVVHMWLLVWQKRDVPCWGSALCKAADTPL
jgi:hypothetical protein